MEAREPAGRAKFPKRSVDHGLVHGIAPFERKRVQGQRLPGGADDDYGDERTTGRVDGVRMVIQSL